MKALFLRILLVLLFLTGLFVTLSGQLSQGGKPIETSVSLKSVVPIIDIVSVPLEELLLMSENQEDGRLKHLYFAKNFDIQINPQNHGRWIHQDNGYKIWQIGIRSKGAYSLGLIFSKFRLKGYARLFVYNEDKSYILGAFTSFNNKTSGILPVSHLPGECIYVQMEVPRQQAEYGELVIGEVAHAYKPIYPDNFMKDGRYDLSDTCNIDINCNEGTDWQVIKRSVCRIVTNGSKYCTGTLVNTTAQKPEPYVLTAAHCIGSQGEADKSIFVFNYESDSCNGPDGKVNLSISGSVLIAVGDTLGDAGKGNVGQDSLDFSLVKLSIAPPDSFNVYYAGWNRTSTAPTKTVSIHHPHGDVKKISLDFDSPVSTYHKEGYFKEYVMGSFWRIVEWDRATTEMGSSGAPLFDQNQRIVGLLTGGEGSCAYPVNDYYTKFGYSWNYYNNPLKHLKTWLDSLNTGAMVIDGRDPFNHTEVKNLNQVRIYPNPGTGKYIIRMDEPFKDDITVNVFTLTGEIVLTDRIAQSGLYELNLYDHSPGLYIVRLQFPDQIIMCKIIHQP